MLEAATSHELLKGTKALSKAHNFKEEWEGKTMQIGV